MVSFIRNWGIPGNVKEKDSIVTGHRACNHKFGASLFPALQMAFFSPFLI